MAAPPTRPVRMSSGGATLDVSSALRSVVRRRWPAFIAFLVVALPGTLFTLSMPDEYDATGASPGRPAR